MNNEILPNDYRETLNLIIQKIQLAQQKAVISANITLLDLYWEIGNVILKKKKEQGWGAKVIETLSKDINKPIGVSEYKLLEDMPEYLQSQLPRAEDIELHIKDVEEIEEQEDN